MGKRKTQLNSSAQQQPTTATGATARYQALRNFYLSIANLDFVTTTGMDPFYSTRLCRLHRLKVHINFRGRDERLNRYVIKGVFIVASSRELQGIIKDWEGSEMSRRVRRHRFKCYRESRSTGVGLDTLRCALIELIDQKNLLIPCLYR